MQQSRLQIKQSLESSRNPVVLCSFGKDSLLLLALAREIRPDIAILYFREKASKFAEKVILDWNLRVFGYAPAQRYLIPFGSGIALVDEMSIGGIIVPLLRDVELSDTCQIETLSPIRTPDFRYDFDLTLWGYRRSDELHPVMQPFSNDFQLGSTRMLAPLYDMTSQQVYKGLDNLSIEYVAQNDTIGMCKKCFASLSTWDRQASLSAFCTKFGYAEAAKAA